MKNSRKNWNDESGFDEEEKGNDYEESMYRSRSKQSMSPSKSHGKSPSRRQERMEDSYD